MRLINLKALLQLLLMFILLFVSVFGPLTWHSQRSLIGALFLQCFCNEKFGRSHLCGQSFAQTVGRGSCFALFTTDSVIILVRALFLITAVCVGPRRQRLPLRLSSRMPRRHCFSSPY